jgi:hypothetical protein
MLAGDVAVEYLCGPEEGYRDDPEADVLARRSLEHLGPRLAELVIAGEESDEDHGDDETKAWHLADAFAGSQAAMFYVEWLRAEARELVMRYRAAIERVADALARHAVLRGEQVAAFVYPPKDRS